MLILNLIFTIVTTTAALNVPNSEESEEPKLSKYVRPSLNNNPKSFTNEENKKPVTSVNYNPVQRSQNYQQVSINQNNPSTGGSFLSPYQTNQLYPNFRQFSTPYFQHAFINTEVMKPTIQYRTITSPLISKLQETSTNVNEDIQKKMLGETFGLHYEYPFLINDKLSSDSDASNQKVEVPTNKVQLPIYRTQYSEPKISDYTFTRSSNNNPIESSTKLSQYYPQKEPINMNKITLPVMEVQNYPNLPEYLRTIETQPVLLNHNLNYQQSNLNFGLTGEKDKSIVQNNNVLPFQSSISSFQGQVIPIQTASSTPEFPLYKGATVSRYPSSLDLAKIPRTYEPLRTQPQLHFQKVQQPSDIVNPYENVNSNTKPGSEILEDVEIITTDPPPPLKNDDEDDFEDERYKNVETEYDKNSNDDEEYSAKQSKESSSESDFVPSKSFPFKEYDEKFGKYSKVNNKDEEDDDKTNSAKFQSYSSSENDEDGGSSSKYSNDYESEPRRSNYEDEDEDGSEKYESQRNSEDSPKEESKRKKYFKKDFYKDFDDFYKKPITKNKYNRKEAPELKRQIGGFFNYNKQFHEEENNPLNYNRKKISQKFSDARKRATESLSTNPIGSTSNSGFYVPSIVNAKHRSFGNEKVFYDLTGI